MKDFVVRILPFAQYGKFLSFLPWVIEDDPPQLGPPWWIYFPKTWTQYLEKIVIFE